MRLRCPTTSALATAASPLGTSASEAVEYVDACAFVLPVGALAGFPLVFMEAFALVFGAGFVFTLRAAPRDKRRGPTASASALVEASSSLSPAATAALINYPLIIFREFRSSVFAEHQGRHTQRRRKAHPRAPPLLVLPISKEDVFREVESATRVVVRSVVGWKGVKDGASVRAEPDARKT